MFDLLKAELQKDVERQKENAHGTMYTTDLTSWYFNDCLTETNKRKFFAGEMDEQTARQKAFEKKCRLIDKWHKDQLKKLEQAENAKDIHHITANVEFVRSRMWGYNPHVRVFGSGYFNGTASGCGYDKESAALAQAFNQDFSILKILYTAKEQALAEGKTDTDTTACTGHDNRNLLGYGSGYSVLPYFEGGVGVNCFISILEKCGFTCNAYYGRSENGYNFAKKAE